jgi:hypothetical protein
MTDLEQQIVHSKGVSPEVEHFVKFMKKNDITADKFLGKNQKDMTVK